MKDDYFGRRYSVLSPLKCTYYPDRMKKIETGEFHQIAPVTAHLVPTLKCNHRCFFCTYGKLKDSDDKAGKITMEAEEVFSAIDSLKKAGVRGVIFTGGGEPTCYPHLIEAMLYAKKNGLEIAINTNGLMKESLITELIRVEPTYIRVSLNAGSRIVQKLTTGVDDYQIVLKNIETMVELKHRYHTRTDISVGYVVNVLNVDDLMNLAETLLEMERRLERKGIVNGLFSLQIRPVSNYENSKHILPQTIEGIADYLEQHMGGEKRLEFFDFMQNGAQCSAKTLEKALKIIEEELIPLFDRKSKMKIIYPRQKYLDLIHRTGRRYNRCLSCPWFLFIWPDGNVYHCVEWAGTSGFEIGNLNEAPIETILSGERRAQVLDKINRSVIHTRCAPVCAHHEMNIFLNDVYESGGIEDPDENRETPRHGCFL
ncbi:MAG: radical SAM/SPASM domain-containing protein [Eubacteriales bacterium]|nr:radical SAM/SPASM domain-containing protein [Eubacteriales bacterium]